MAKKKPSGQTMKDVIDAVNGISDSDSSLPDLECTRRAYDEKLGAWDFFVDWRGEDLSGQVVKINGVDRRVKFCNFYDDVTVLTVAEELDHAGEDG